jgi:HK97 family phage major capsid protein
MPFNNMISRTDAAALIPEEVSNEILNRVTETSAVMRMARRLQNMSRGQERLPVVSALPTAYFVSGDNGIKQTTEVNWANKYIYAEELACIVPIPEAVLDDTSYDIWGEVKPLIEEGLGLAVDQAVLYGTNIPANWTIALGSAGIVAGANSASQKISLANYTDLYEALMGETVGGAAGLLGLLEQDGFIATGHIGHTSLMTKLRNCRDAEGNPIFRSNSVLEKTTYSLDGAPMVFPLNGSIDSSQALNIAGQWSQLVYAMRKDITYKVLDQAVIQDSAGNIIYNLAQQDMVALRAVMRLGFALPNPVNRVNTNSSTRYPFSALTA